MECRLSSSRKQLAPAKPCSWGGGTIEQAINLNYRDPQSAQWNVTVERELTSQTGVRVS
jgi:hypothetical protein